MLGSATRPRSGSPAGLAGYRANMRIHVLPVLGSRPLQQLTAAMLNGLYGGLLANGGERGPLAPKTVRYIHTIIHKALADAVDAGVLHANVAERAKPPRPLRKTPPATGGRLIKPIRE